MRYPQANFDKNKTNKNTDSSSSIMISLKISHPTFALLFIYSFAPDHRLFEYIINHYSESIEQEVLQAFLGLLRRPPFGAINKISIY